MDDTNTNENKIETLSKGTMEVDEENLDDANELLIKGNIRSFIDNLKNKDGQESVVLEDRHSGLVIELTSRKFNVTELSGLALELIKSIPIKIKERISYIE
ncbi:hypothetical protein M0R19_01965 [Candidatus Pacearchaeota archaeon]|nr:hypothetical protein [Candidatus Pacearchaeota archaeon]